MKKFIFLAMVVLVTIILIPNLSRAYTVNVGKWTEYVSNPIFGGATDGVNKAYYPCVAKVGGTYHMWYGDGINTRHATSTNANFSGATFPGTVITGLVDNYYHPRVLYNSSGWDVGGTHFGDPFLLYMTTSNLAHLYAYHSADGNSWTQIGEVMGVINYGDNPTGAYSFDVLWEGGTTWKAYADNVGGHIQYYVSTDGLNWTGIAKNILDANLQSWETNNHISVHVIKLNNNYILFYSSGTTNNNQSIGMAVSTDAQNYAKCDANPFLSIFNSPPSWRNERTYTPYVMQDGLNWSMYFSGRSTPSAIYSVGYATNTGLFCNIQDAINAASSGDIINVAAGTYNESLDITKSLTIQGAGQTTTFIDQSANATAGNVVYIHGACGSVKVDGFTIKTGIASTVACDGVSISGLTSPGMITISNNTIWGNQSAVKDNLCLIAGYFSITTTKLVFDHNIVHGGWSSTGVANPILIERWMGTTEITNNTIDHGTIDGVASDVIVFMNYDNGNITQKQLISGNTIDMGWGTIYDASHRGAGITIWSGYNGGTLPGGYTNIEISNNNLFNLKPSRRGISLYNSSSGDGSGGNIVNALISGNTISNAPSYSGEFGIRVRGKATGTQITTNTISGVTDAVLIAPNFGHEPLSTAAHNNSLLGVVLSCNNLSINNVDATNNWWGTAIESQILAKLFGTITYNPWMGMTPYTADVIPCTVGLHNLTNSNPGGSIQFIRVGTNNIIPSITIQRFDGLPNTPASAGTPVPVYFQVTPTNLANYTFEATIVLDLSAIPGFDANTIVMMSSDGTNWLGSNGTYNAVAHTYTFTTNHFSTIAFVNPVLANEVNLYVSTSTTSYGNTIYPNTSWNAPLTSGADGFDWIPSAGNHDWTYKQKAGTFYIVPVGAGTTPRSFFEAHMKIAWNPNLVSGVAISQGNLFDGNTVFSTNMGSNWVTIDASCLDSNKTPGVGKYLAALVFDFNNDTSGFSPITIQEATIIYNDGQNGFPNASVVTQDMGGKFKLYLGDFASASPSSQDVGDGLITGTDLAGFSSAYWSSYTNPSVYKSKYDVGPTLPARYYFGLPHPDGTINFEDLAVFSMGYSKTGSGSLPANPKPIIFSLDKIEKGTDGLLRLPVRISGGVYDLRAFSMKLNYSSDMEYSGVEMAEQMLEETNFLIGKSETGKVYADGAAFGTALSKEGVIAYVTFNEKTTGNHNASIESVIARNSGNLDLDVSLTGINNEAGIPKIFNLCQNYPNPFNPVTKIEYALPKDVKVSIKIYDLLGREVAVIVNDVQKAGYYKVDWNGSSLASGVYFYKMVAGDFVAVKKMMLIK